MNFDKIFMSLVIAFMICAGLAIFVVAVVGTQGIALVLLPVWLIVYKWRNAQERKYNRRWWGDGIDH